jgi:hypothetical protein
LIPFPYVVKGVDFAVARCPEPNIDGYFAIKQNWLEDGNQPVSVTDFGNFVAQLIHESEADVGTIHGIIFPETALTQDLVLGLADILARKFGSLELLISGTLRSVEGASRNEAVVIRLENGERVGHFVQPKHHRWRMADGQIIQYQLGHILDPSHGWWESIDVHGRTIQFGLNRHQAVVAALVCEDLARFDPVLPVVTAVGPNLVVALLMDGPQLEARWSARYATVLAEDPGSSVITLTSLGMVLRSRRPGEDVRRVIGLWKDRRGAAVELILPPGSHGLILCLACGDAVQRTLDLRSDGGTTTEYRLAGVRSVGARAAPNWVERRPLSH